MRISAWERPSRASAGAVTKPVVLPQRPRHAPPRVSKAACRSNAARMPRDACRRATEARCSTGRGPHQWQSHLRPFGQIHGIPWEILCWNAQTGRTAVRTVTELIRSGDKKITSSFRWAVFMYRMSQRSDNRVSLWESELCKRGIVTSVERDPILQVALYSKKCLLWYLLNVRSEGTFG